MNFIRHPVRHYSCLAHRFFGLLKARGKVDRAGRTAELSLDTIVEVLELRLEQKSLLLRVPLNTRLGRAFELGIALAMNAIALLTLGRSGPCRHFATLGVSLHHAHLPFKHLLSMDIHASLLSLSSQVTALRIPGNIIVTVAIVTDVVNESPMNIFEKFAAGIITLLLTGHP